MSFDWKMPTNEAYASSDNAPLFAPSDDFLPARQKLDYTYHRNPIVERQIFQNAILHRIVHANEEQLRQNQQQSQQQPWIVFTAGPMGVGKSYVLSQLHQRDLFRLDDFIKIDPDMIKSELPEQAGYLQEDPATAATKLHRESTQMSDVLLEYALMHGQNLLVDGSLRDVEYYQQLFSTLRQRGRRIAILYVSAKSSVILSRAEHRAATTGRSVPKHLLQASIDQVPKSVAALAPLTDVAYEIANNDDEPLELTVLKSLEDTSVSDGPGSWENFRAIWHGDEDDYYVERDIYEEYEDEQETKQEEKSNDHHKNPKMVCKLLSSFEDADLHQIATQIWKKAYPAFCPRCSLYCDSQCGVCIHKRHICACSICNPKTTHGHLSCSIMKRIGGASS